MAIYAGLDVSDKVTHVCVVDGDGAMGDRVARGCATDSEVIAKMLGGHALGLVRWACLNNLAGRREPPYHPGDDAPDSRRQEWP